MASDRLLQAWQRRYFAWAELQYAKMEPALAAEARRIDRWLYGRGGLGLIAGLALAVAGSVAGLVAAGFPFLLAVICSPLVWLGLPLAGLGAWLQPQKFSPRGAWRVARWGSWPWATPAPSSASSLAGWSATAG